MFLRFLYPNFLAYDLKVGDEIDDELCSLPIGLIADMMATNVLALSELLSRRYLVQLFLYLFTFE